MSSDDEWEPQFEHIDWNDIVEAELSGDFDTLQCLRDKSQELKRSFSCPTPTTTAQEDPMPTPPQPLFKVPRKTPSSAHASTQARPFQHWDNDYPTLPTRNSLHTSNVIPPSSSLSYAQIVETRQTKRTASERLCLSPVEIQPKRSALSELITTPKELKPERGLTMTSTPSNITTTAVEDAHMDSTPDIESRPSKSVAAVQRRLFPTAKENNSPKSTSNTPSEKKFEELTDHRVIQRAKQIEYGKNTLGYQKYIQTLPRWQRKFGDPMTPDKNKKCSTRAWQGQIRVWRRALHKYDPPKEQGVIQFTTEQAALCDLDLPGHLWDDEKNL